MIDNEYYMVFNRSWSKRKLNIADREIEQTLSLPVIRCAKATKAKHREGPVVVPLLTSLP